MSNPRFAMRGKSSSQCVSTPPIILGMPRVPMTIIEAYSVGTPVIGAKIGGIPEIIIDGKTGYQFTTGNSDNLQETIKKIFSLTPEAYQRLSAGTLEFAHENLSLENYYPRLIAFYSHFLKQE